MATRERKRIHAFRRAPDGSAFHKCEDCGVSVAIALLDMFGTETKLSNLHLHSRESKKMINLFLLTRSMCSKKESVFDWVSKFSKKADSYAQGIRDHMSLAPKISETVKGKLKVGARILQSGGIGKVFRKYFSVGKREKLLKASQCCLSTTSGPIASLLFISNEKVAFRSDRSLTMIYQNGDSIRIPYKVLIPLTSIKRVSPSENIDNPSQKYIQMVTMDDFEFWFMGFVNYHRTFKYLQHVILEQENSC